MKRLRRHMQKDLGRDKRERGIKGSVGSAGRLGINRLNAVEGKELEEWARRWKRSLRRKERILYHKTL